MKETTIFSSANSRYLGNKKGDVDKFGCYIEMTLLAFMKYLFEAHLNFVFSLFQ